MCDTHKAKKEEVEAAIPPYDKREQAELRHHGKIAAAMRAMPWLYVDPTSDDPEQP